MSDDRLDERNRNLSQEGFHSADWINAGATDHDNEEVIRYKIAQQRAASQSALSGFDTGMDDGPGGGVMHIDDVERTAFVIKAVLWGIGFFFISSILGALWSAKDELFEYWQESRRAEAADKRVKEYTDFSRLSQWPEKVQEAYRKQENKPLEKLMDEVPRDLNQLSAARRHALGAQIWFKISSKGAGASDYLDTVQKAPHRVGMPIIRRPRCHCSFCEASARRDSSWPVSMRPNPMRDWFGMESGPRNRTGCWGPPSSNCLLRVRSRKRLPSNR